jgi:uncharacterized protein with gpF-like domain
MSEDFEDFKDKLIQSLNSENIQLKLDKQRLEKENKEWRQCVKDMISNMSTNIGFIKGSVDGLILRFNCKSCNLGKE